MTKYLLMGGAIGLLLAGCTSTPLTLPPQPVTLQESTPLNLSLEWWQEFNDPQLNHYIELALSHNSDMAIAKHQIASYLALFDVAESELYPKINASASLSRNRTAITKTKPSEISTTYATSLALASYEIDLWGEVRQATTIAQSDLLKSHFSAHTVKLSIISTVAQTYITISALEEQLRLVQHNESLLQQTYTMTYEKYKQGTILESELILAKSRIEGVKTSRLEIESALSRAKNQLFSLIGKNVPLNISPLTSLSLAQTPAYLPSDLLERRPDIALAYHNLLQAHAKVAIAKTAYFPKITLTGGLGFQSNDMQNLLSSSNRTWQFGPSVSLPIFSAGAIKGQIRHYTAKEQEILEMYQKAIRDAFYDTDNALTSYHYYREILHSKEQQFKLNQQAYTLGQKQYQQGVLSYIGLLALEEQLLTTQQQMIQAKQNTFMASINLYKALGGGWKEPRNQKETIRDKN